MSQKKIRLIRKLAFGQVCPTGHLSAKGSKIQITNKTINRRIKRFYKGLGDGIRQKINRENITEFNKKPSQSIVMDKPQGI
jgi:hypothetical protein